MKIGLVGIPGCGKSTVFGALTGMAVETGYGSRADKANVGVVKVPDPRVDALAGLFDPKKTTYAEVTFRDLAGGRDGALDRTVLNSMREVDALCQVLRAFPDAAGEPGEPLTRRRMPWLERTLRRLQLAVVAFKLRRHGDGGPGGAGE